MKSNLVFLQARLDSTRLPDKVLRQVNNVALIDLQIERILKSKLVGGLVIVIPDTEINDKLSEHLLSQGRLVFRGSPDNVLQRFYDASKIYKSELIIRLTADCPLVMPSLIDCMLEYFDQVRPEYLSNRLPPTFPDGLDIEIFQSEILTELIEHDLTDQEKEHVTLGIYGGKTTFKVANYANNIDLSNNRWTVDYMEDFEFIEKVYEYFWQKRFSFETNDILEYINLNPLENNNKLGAAFRDIALKNHK
jgi:spore coat polysaccharide biosynthesis protein SpsF (cytidylyltransferase family)